MINSEVISSSQDLGNHGSTFYLWKIINLLMINWAIYPVWAVSGYFLHHMNYMFLFFTLKRKGCMLAHVTQFLTRLQNRPSLFSRREGLYACVLKVFLFRQFGKSPFYALRPPGAVIQTTVLILCIALPILPSQQLALNVLNIILYQCFLNNNLDF